MLRAHAKSPMQALPGGGKEGRVLSRDLEKSLVACANACRHEYATFECFQPPIVIGTGRWLRSFDFLKSFHIGKAP